MWYTWIPRTKDHLEGTQSVLLCQDSLFVVQKTRTHNKKHVILDQII